MSKLYQDIVLLFEHYKDVIATPTERLTIESFKVPSKGGVGKLESSIVPMLSGKIDSFKVPSKVGVRKYESSIVPTKITWGKW